MALGVVFGDIGTSPLYAYETALEEAGGAGAAVGVASLIIWTVFLVVNVKYALVIMRADFHGEGGIFALMAILRERGRALSGAIVGLAVLGAAMLLGDGAITPAVSVLSAVEGFAAVYPGWGHFSMPLALGILLVLFAAQRFGTGGLGGIFGPVMLVWFVVIGGTGGAAVATAPSVLTALNPLHAVHLLAVAGWQALPVVGAAVLAITGAEALYADLGHFGRAPILRSWRFVVLPALVLNYLGQAALVVRDPALATDPNLFFHLAPPGAPRAAMAVLATFATVIASQALISAVFSLTSQAMDLGFLPRIHVYHTSREHRGQLYVPVVNFLLGGVCLLLVAVFRTSEALANAYGIAVTAAMAATSIVFCVVLFSAPRVPKPAAWLVLAGLLALDLPLFASTLTKFLEGGFVPVLIAVAVGALMFSWIRGRELVRKATSYSNIGTDGLSARLASGTIPRVPGTEVFIVRRPFPQHGVACILEQARRVKILAENVVILLLDPNWADPREDCGAVHVESLPGGLWIIRAEHGYMTEPDVPEMMQKAGGLAGFLYQPDETFFVVAREIIIACPQNAMPRWQRHLFAFMARNIVPGPHYLRIPPDRLILYTWLLRL